MDHFNTNLQLLRLSQNLNIRQCAEHIGFKDSTWGNYENNHSKPGFADLLKIAKYFGVSLTQLVEEDLSKDSKVFKKAVKHQPPVSAMSSMLNEPAAEYRSLSKRMDELEKQIKQLQDAGTNKRK